MSKIIITGGSSGIGLAISKKLVEDGHEVINFDNQRTKEYIPIKKFKTFIVNLHEPEEISNACTNIHEVDILINCAGVNFIDWIENTPLDAWDDVMNTNARAIFLLARELIPQLIERKGTILNIVSNASHMPMTNSIAYNASKGAAHIMTLQMSRELAPKGVTVFGISPNRCKGTAMSGYIDSRVCGLRGWTPEYAREYQLKALPAGEETDPAVLAEFVAFILSTKERHKYMAGTIIPYGK